MVIQGNQGIALQATGLVDLTLGSGFASVSANSIGMVYNSTG
jgi:hypothetical protein